MSTTKGRNLKGLGAHASGKVDGTSRAEVTPGNVQQQKVYRELSGDEKSGSFRVRHITSISVRNATFPRRLESVIEDHSDESRTTPGVMDKADGKPAPRPKKASRRKSDLAWMNTTSAVRQKKLNDAVEERLLDMHFTIEVKSTTGAAVAVWNSEIVRKTMNPDFKAIEISETSNMQPGACTACVVKVWARKQAMDDFALLIRWEVHLRSLIHLTNNLESWRLPIPENTILFRMADGGTYTGGILEGHAPSVHLQELVNTSGSHTTTVFTSSFDNLLKIKNFIECDDDAQRSSEEVQARVNTLLKDLENVMKPIVEERLANQASIDVSGSVAKLNHEISSRKLKRDQTENLMEARRTELQNGIFRCKDERKECSSWQAEMEYQENEWNILRGQLNVKHHDCFKTLSTIFPIEPVEGKPLCFTICGLFLPKGDSLSSDDADQRNHTAAALGFVCHLLTALAIYQLVHLPFPMTVKGSESTIFDPISNHEKLPSVVKRPGQDAYDYENPARVFNLFERGQPLWRFEWGVMLLDKNLEAIMTSIGLKVIYRSNTLANVRDLLKELTSDTHQLPQRQYVAAFDEAALNDLSLNGDVSMSKATAEVQPMDGAGETFFNFVESTPNPKNETKESTKKQTKRGNRKKKAATVDEDPFFSLLPFENLHVALEKEEPAFDKRLRLESEQQKDNFGFMSVFGEAYDPDIPARKAAKKEAQRQSRARAADSIGIGSLAPPVNTTRAPRVRRPPPTLEETTLRSPSQRRRGSSINETEMAPKWQGTI